MKSFSKLSRNMTVGRYVGSFVACAIAFALNACTVGQSAPPPNNVVAIAGDSSITVTWDAVPGVDYLLYYAPMSGVTTQNCSGNPGCQTMMRVTSPLVISVPSNLNLANAAFTTNGNVVGLTNGTTFSITIDGRINGGPGGPGSPAVSAVPRLAGNTGSWSAGASLNSLNDLRAVASGAMSVNGVSGTTVSVAAGLNGALYSSSDGLTWTSLAHPLPSTHFYAATAYATSNLIAANYLVAGGGGALLLSSDAVNWTAQTTNTTNDLYAIAANGSGGYVAVGANGTIVTGSIGAAATVATSGTTQPLYGVIYANGIYVAVGAAGTLLTSSNGVNWTANNTGTTDLKGIAYGGYTISAGIASGTNTFVAVGATGSLVTSIDGGVTWQVSPTLISTGNLNAVTYGHQFVAVGDLGVIYTSTDGLTWQLQTQTPASSQNLLAIAHGRFDYSAVGAAGTHIYAK